MEAARNKVFLRMVIGMISQDQLLINCLSQIGIPKELSEKLLRSKLSGGSLSLEERSSNYSKAFPKFPPLRIWNGRIEDIWFLGQNYKSQSSYYGSYPGNYLKRMNVIFPDCHPVLHLFSGSLPPGNYVRFDRRYDMKPEIVGDAHYLSDYLALNGWGNPFGAIFADPPYSIEDSEHYGCTLIKRNTVIDECHKILMPGGFLIWLDQVWPQYSKTNWDLYGKIGIEISTNHRSRSVTILKKRG